MYRLLTIKIIQILMIMSLIYSNTSLSNLQKLHHHYESVIGIDENQFQYSQKPIQTDSFQNPLVQNVSMMKILKHLSNEYLFVISKNYILVRIDLRTLNIIDTFVMEYCKSSPKICAKQIRINHLANTEISGNKLFYFCFFQKFPPGYSLYRYSTVNCRIPHNKITDQIRWLKKGFSSNKPNQNTFAVKHTGYVFTGAYTDHSLGIIRTTEPNLYGKMDESKQLLTPNAPFYFEANSKFLVGFQYESSVYFVVSESIDVQSNSCHKGNSNRKSKKKIQVTRLFRICSNDPGGPVDSSRHNFGTSAKADLICPSLTSNGEVNDRIVYTRAADAYWSENMLFVLFTSQEGLPRDSVICTYKPSSFDKVFDGSMKYTEIHQSQHNSCNYDKNRDIVANNLPSLCKKLARNELNLEQLKEASNMASIGLYRLNSIEPISKKALLQVGRLNSFDKIQVVHLPDDTRILIVYSTQSNMVWFYNYRDKSENDDNLLCYQDVYETPQNIKDITHKISGQEVFLFILMKNSRIEKLDLTKRVCSRFSVSKALCLEKSPLFCGWSLINKICTVRWNERKPYFTPLSRVGLWIRSWKCMKKSSIADLTPPNICNINQTSLELSCHCKHTCLNKRCGITISNCKGKIQTNNWSTWSKWGSCKYELVKRRSREDVNHSKTQKRSITQVEKCSIKNQVSKSQWTAWQRQIATMTRYQAQCILDASNSTIKAVIAQDERNCRHRKCYKFPDDRLDRNQHWSSWSKCERKDFQYRLRNCSKLNACSAYDIQIKICAADGTSKNTRSLKDNTLSKRYTTFHLLFAIMATSVIWLMIALIVFMVLCCQQTNNSRNRRSTNRFSSFFSLSDRKNTKTTSASVNNIICYHDSQQPTTSTQHHTESNLHHQTHPFVFRTIPQAISNDYVSPTLIRSTIDIASSMPSQTNSSTTSIN